MAELEAYSGDVAEQVMSGTLAETASLHSSSADQSPRRPYASHDDASSVTDDLFAPPPQELPQPRPEGESRTASGSHSHDTITVSDMPSVPAAAQAGESVRKTHASARTAPRPPPHGHSRRAPPAPRRSFAPARPMYTPERRPMHAPSVASGAASDRGSHSFASAAPSLGEPPSRSVRSGPMGRYASSVGGRSSLAAPPSRPLVRRREPEMDQTLRAIQASLSALTERLDRAESSLVRGERAEAAPLAALRGTMTAATNALNEVGTLLGIGGSRTPQDAPSYTEWHTSRATPSRSVLWKLLRSPIQFVVAAASLAFRLLLDLTSIAVLATLVIAALRRISGRGDPWIALRLMGRVGQRLSFLSNAANRRTTLRALLASALVCGLAMEMRV